MTGEEAFEFAAAVAGVTIGLAAVLALAVLAGVGAWRLFQYAGEASQAATRAALSVEELARRLAAQPPSREGPPTDGSQWAELRQQAELLLDQQRRLQEMARDLMDMAALESRPAPAALEELEAAVGRLDSTVGQMAAYLANLVQSLERQQGRW